MLIRTGDFDSFAANGGRPFDPTLPAAVFLHGAGLDHSVWALHSRWFAHNGWSVLAPDLPGHGRSDGRALRSIAAMADWLAVLLDAAGAGPARLIGHSLGSLVALETAARHPGKVASLGLIGTALPVQVGPALLDAARANGHAAIDMISIWGHGFRAGLGGSPAPGIWMMGAASRLLERARPGVLFADLSACNDYDAGLEAAAGVTVPVTLVFGERDLMTPLKAGKALAAALPNSHTVVLPGAGHMLMAERPDEVLRALAHAQR
jgi:pimeloyl-ACP methyl ester carboxylesterase